MSYSIVRTLQIIISVVGCPQGHQEIVGIYLKIRDYRALHVFSIRFSLIEYIYHRPDDGNGLVSELLDFINLLTWQSARKKYCVYSVFLPHDTDFSAVAVYSKSQFCLTPKISIWSQQVQKFVSHILQ